MTDKQIWALVRSLSLREKAALCSGADAWTTKANAARGIPALRMADGPHGVRVEDPRNHRENAGWAKPATCFPPECAIACSWSPRLAAEVGAAIAEECLHYGVGLLLAPGVNIRRSPLGGRNFEYYSEDPLLSGEMAAGFIQGVQGKGVGTSLKHYALNNQETFRMSVSAAVDNRALFDLYLRPFEIAVKKAQPATVMCSYNKIGGIYASEHRGLLTDILRLRLGFRGAVISDWGAVNNRPAGIAAGMDLEMPASGGMNDWLIERAIETGSLAEQELDAACCNLLRLIFTYSQNGKPTPACNFEAHHALAVKALEKSAVLLKNQDDMLPLALPQAGQQALAVIGEMAARPHYQGGGSSAVNPKKLVSFVDAMAAEGLPCCYQPGYHNTEANDGLLAAAAQAAATAQNVLLFLGLPDLFDCEGYDREHLRLPSSQLQLLKAVCAANPNVCVVLCGGGPVEAPWLPKIKALLCLHLGGQGIGEAVLNLVFGRACPAGKLTESWPQKLEDTPCHAHFPAGPIEVAHSESLYVGYRYYDKAGVEPLFPFGYGLSYTHFAYSHLRLSTSRLAAGQNLQVHFKLKNTGDRPGEEVAQVYAGRPQSALFRPERELVGFVRVALLPGEERDVAVEIPPDAFACYEPALGGKAVEEGPCELWVGPSSRELPLHMTLELAGSRFLPSATAAAQGPYGHVKGNHFPAETFARLYGELNRQALLGNALPKKGEYTAATPLALMSESFAARLFSRLAVLVGRHTVRFSPDKAANKKAATAMSRELPFKNIPLNTQGIVNPRAAAALLRLCNGQGGFGAFLAAMLKKPPYRKQK